MTGQRFPVLAYSICPKLHVVHTVTIPTRFTTVAQAKLLLAVGQLHCRLQYVEVHGVPAERDTTDSTYVTFHISSTLTLPYSS